MHQFPVGIPSWMTKWPAALWIGAYALAIGVTCTLTGFAAAKEYVTTLGCIMLAVGANSMIVAAMVYLIWRTQQPISGTVVERFIQVSGFMPDDKPLGATLGKIIGEATTDPAHLRCTAVAYWLYVAPFKLGQTNRWFRVNRTVFDAHPLGSDYNANNPVARTEQPAE